MVNILWASFLTNFLWCFYLHWFPLTTSLCWTSDKLQPLSLQLPKSCISSIPDLTSLLLTCRRRVSILTMGPLLLTQWLVVSVMEPPGPFWWRGQKLQQQRSNWLFGCCFCQWLCTYQPQGFTLDNILMTKWFPDSSKEHFWLIWLGSFGSVHWESGSDTSMRRNWLRFSFIQSCSSSFFKECWHTTFTSSLSSLSPSCGQAKLKRFATD